MGCMAEADTSPDTRPIPPRFWWLKRLVVAVVIFMALLVGLRYLSLHVAKRRLAAEIAAIQARGEPLTPEDFADRPVPPEQDGGPDLLAAMKMFQVPPQHQQSWNQIPHFAPSTQNPAMVDAVLAANQEALAKVRAARGKPVINWGMPIRPEVVSLPLAMNRQLRDLCDGLMIAAQRAQAQRRSDEAIEYLRDWLMVARSMESQPHVVSHLWAAVLQQHLSNVIQSQARGLQIGEGGGAASEAQVRALIAELLDENPRERSGRRWAWQGERMMQMHLIEAIASEDEMKRTLSGVDRGGIFVWWMRPLSVANAEDLLEMANMGVAAASAEDFAQASEIISAWQNRSRHLAQLNRASAVSGNLRGIYDAIHDRRVAAVALAEQMFRTKYKREPKSPQELVPEFLTSVPLDPFKPKRLSIPVSNDAKGK
jgi:hypothetical protein